MPVLHCLLLVVKGERKRLTKNKHEISIRVSKNQEIQTNVHTSFLLSFLIAIYLSIYGSTFPSSPALSLSSLSSLYFLSFSFSFPSFPFLGFLSSASYIVQTAVSRPPALPSCTKNTPMALFIATGVYLPHASCLSSSPLFPTSHLCFRPLLLFSFFLSVCFSRCPFSFVLTLPFSPPRLFVDSSECVDK